MKHFYKKLNDVYPDGICLDSEGAIWLAAPHPGEVIRVQEGVNITHRLNVATKPYACMLGGPERRTLFICAAGSSDPMRHASSRTEKSKL